MTIMIGTPNGDFLVGFSTDDLILADTGNDTIAGNDGNDLIFGNPDQDEISGNLGNDILFSGKNNDVVNGNEGDDWVSGDQGNDTLFGNAGSDVILGMDGNDQLYGGKDSDFLSGNTGDDELYGDENNDTLHGGKNNDIVRGGKQNDLILGELGNDILWGDQGSDTLSGGTGCDLFVMGKVANLAKFQTTGGAALADADMITDFRQSGFDLIGLMGGLTFADLNITQGTGIHANDTLIQETGTGEYLAILKGVNVADITGSNFTTEIRPITSVLEFTEPIFKLNEDGTGLAAVTVQRNGCDLETTVAATLVFSGDSAQPGEDFDPTPIVITFAPGETSQIITIPIINDFTPEGEESFKIRLENPTSNARIGFKDAAEITLEDNDITPSPAPSPLPSETPTPETALIPGILAFTAANFSELEGNSGTPNKIIATIQRTDGSDGEVSVQVALSPDSTAKTPNDYINNFPITVTFAAGETNQSVEIPIVGDDAVEPDETLQLTLINPTGGAALGTQTTATYTILNDDTAATFDFSAANYSVIEGNTSGFTTNAAIRVNRQGNLTNVDTVEIQLSDGAAPSATGGILANGGIDYSNLIIPVTFNPGDTFVDITLPIAGDTESEADENVALTLTNPSVGSVIGSTQPTAVLTINNDDLPTVSLAAPNANATETGTPGTFRISRGAATFGNLTVNLAIDGSSINPAMATDYSLSGGGVSINGSNVSVTIPDGQSFVDITLTATDDNHAELDETLALDLAAGNYIIDGVNNTGTVTISRNDTGVNTTVDDASLSPPYGNLEGTLRLAIENANLFAGLDTINFDLPPAPQTINLTGVLPDLTDDVNLVNGTGAGNLTVRRNTGGNYRIFSVTGAVNATFDGLTIADGLLTAVTGNTDAGAGIANLGTGTININNSILNNHQADFSGAAVSNINNGTINVNNSTFSNNQSTSLMGAGLGSGIFNIGTGVVNVDNSTFSNNTGLNGGAAIYNEGTLTIANNSAFSNNQVNFFGGAINNTGSLTINDSTFSSNQAGLSGGAIANSGTNLTINNTTFASNQSNDFGGAISTNGAAVTIDGSTFSMNSATEDGGAIINDENLTITNSTLSNNIAGRTGGAILQSSSGNNLTIMGTNITLNQAQLGGAVGILAGTATLTNSTLGNNTTTNDGGGIYKDGSGALNITSSTISNNTATTPGTGGGGIYATASGAVTIDTTTIANNMSGNNGGGITNLTTVPMTLTNSTLSSNSAANQGGGITNFGSLDITNSTLSSNISNSTGGGGIAQFGNAININHTTLTLNQSNGGVGGGIYNNSGNAINVHNTIIAENTGMNPDFSGTLTSQGYNFIGEDTGATIMGTTTGNLVGNSITPLDPLLNPLANNGGITQTHALQSASAAIDAGDPGFMAPPNFDQRGAGFNRVVNMVLDIGAFEFV